MGSSGPIVTTMTGGSKDRGVCREGPVRLFDGIADADDCIITSLVADRYVFPGI